MQKLRLAAEDGVTLRMGQNWDEARAFDFVKDSVHLLGNKLIAKLDQLYVELNRFIAAAGDVTKGLQQGNGSIGRLLKDPKMAQSLEGITLTNRQRDSRRTKMIAPVHRRPINSLARWKRAQSAGV